MNKEAQRIAIAKVCGWNVFPVRSADFRLEGLPPGKKRRDWIPDYLQDQNAIHEAKKILTPAQRDRYACFLGAITGGRRIDYGAARVEATTEVLFADAGQQCEAFLWAIDGWIEDEPKS